MLTAPAFPKPTRTVKQSKPLRRRNAKRCARRRREDFGERGPAVRAMYCLTLPASPRRDAAAGGCSGQVQAAHAKSRGAGGDRRHLIPLCAAHHAEQHRRGVRTFERLYDLDLYAEADRIARELDARGLP